MNLLPQARNTDLAVQDLGKELLIYDLKTNCAYTLNKTVMIVFEACDGKGLLNDLKRTHRFTDDLIYLTLDKLKAHNLLEGEYTSPFAGMSFNESGWQV